MALSSSFLPLPPGTVRELSLDFRTLLPSPIHPDERGCHSICSGLSGAPHPERYVHTPRAMNVTLFGKRIFFRCELIKDLEMSPFWTMGWALNPKTSILIRDTQRKTCEEEQAM